MRRERRLAVALRRLVRRRGRQSVVDGIPPATQVAWMRLTAKEREAAGVIGFRVVGGLAIAVVVASCGAMIGSSVPATPSKSLAVASDPGPSSVPVETPIPVAASKPSEGVAPSDVPSKSPSATPTAVVNKNCRSEVLLPGCWMVSLVDYLRVRSEPRVSDDSVMYEPLLPKGTNFSIRSGPVLDSGYCWYRVELATGLLDGGITHGWVAQGSRVGLPWIKNVPID